MPAHEHLSPDEFSQIDLDQRAVDARQNAIDMGMVDEFGDLSEKGEAYVRESVEAYKSGEY